MNHREIQSRADAYLDGTLGRRERRQVQQHLASCPDCRGELESISTLRRLARELPAEVQPERDLWSGIEGRLGPQLRPRTESSSRWSRLMGRGLREGLAAAAAVAVLLVGVVADRDRGTSPVADPGTRAQVLQPDSRAMLSRMIWGLEEESRGAGRSLIAAVQANSNPVAAEGVQGIDRSLRVLDRAIVESAEALRADPDNQVLLRMLSRYYRQRLALMQQATHLAVSS